MRDDEQDPPADPEEILKNAPQRDGDHFRVRAVLDE
jgi:Asp-tRNA(Asn)/Glu-tRNA(Gln) amidotransferase C subunit